MKAYPVRGYSLFLSLSLALLLNACQSGSPIRPASTITPQPTPSPIASTPTQPANLPIARPSNGPTSQHSTPPPQGGTAILGLVGQPASLNPITENNPALHELTPLLFDTLLRVDPQSASLQPGLAQSWEYSDDGQRVTFHVPSNLKWSDGIALTAATMAESLKATQHPALRAFSDIKALDDETLTFTFTAINCAAVTTVAQLPLFPPTEITATMPTGSGPFMVANWSDNKRTLTLAPNPNYHGSAPFLDGLILRFLADDEATIALSEGQFDVVGPLQSPHEASTLSVQSLNFTNITYLTPKIIYLAINFDPKNDGPIAPEVREALLLALDREAILAEALDGEGQAIGGSLLPGHWAVNKALSPPDYDPAAARALLTNAGLRDTDGDGWLDQNGQRLELSLRVNGENKLHQNLGWLASSYYRELGLFARAEGVPFDSLVDDLFSHDFRLAIFSWRILPDPDQRLYWHSNENIEGFGLNFTSYNDSQLDRLFDEAITIPGCDARTRVKIYAQIQRILAQERPVDFLFVPDQHLFVAKRLHGVEPGPFAALTWNATQWFLKE